ncbi:MAG: gliding motility-associated C-terminal domain-containing protein [Burkholderiales bacterium]|nr:gliding motility-associated C-terminal domain-containing protein [Flavobacterium sp.]
MKASFRLKHLLFLVIFSFSAAKSFSQCFQIESILVDACDSGSDEGLNEMVRFKVGSSAINTLSLSVNWPNNTWQGLVQNATTLAKVVALNAQVTAAGGCGQILEPVGGVLPANAKVILVTSFNFSAATNVFGAITENIYILFQNNPANTAGHFANYNATPGIRTLSISFGTCSDTVSYERSLLINTNGTSGGTTAINNGSTVNFTSAGSATYINNGCVAPVEVFEVNAGASPLTACAGATISLSATAQGQQTLQWSAPSGFFSAPNALLTNYTVSNTVSGAVVLTLTAMDFCGNTKTSTITINVGSTVTPTFNAVAPICSAAPLSALPVTSNNGITGSWSPALNNTVTTTYTFTPALGQCSSTASLTITVGLSATPTFTSVAPICSGASLSPLPTASNNGITGSWSPALNNAATTTYTFTPTIGQCASTALLTINVGLIAAPTFAAVAPICSGAALIALPTTSNNGITGSWSPTLNNTATTAYTFTPAIGQCASAATLTIIVGLSATPNFASVAPICSGAPLTALPTTSNNGIAGSWSPALNNMATTTYTFTPDIGQCATTTTLSIDVQEGLDYMVVGSCNNNAYVFQVVDASFDLNNADFNWQNASGLSVGTNSSNFDATAYLNSTVVFEQLPLNFFLTVTSASGCVKTKPILLESVYCAIPKGISPNGDNANDSFDLSLMDVKQLSVFNRYGTKVYSKVAYTNQWYGQGDNGKELPDATYYYVIEFNNQHPIKTGWVYLNN